MGSPLPLPGGHYIWCDPTQHPNLYHSYTTLTRPDIPCGGTELLIGNVVHEPAYLRITTPQNFPKQYWILEKVLNLYTLLKLDTSRFIFMTNKGWEIGNLESSGLRRDGKLVALDAQNGKFPKNFRKNLVRGNGVGERRSLALDTRSNHRS